MHSPAWLPARPSPTSTSVKTGASPAPDTRAWASRSQRNSSLSPCHLKLKPLMPARSVCVLPLSARTNKIEENSDEEQAMQMFRMNRNLRIKFGLEQDANCGLNSHQSEHDTELMRCPEIKLLPRGFACTNIRCLESQRSNDKLSCEAFASFLKQKFALQASPAKQLQECFEREDLPLEDLRRKAWRERLHSDNPIVTFPCFFESVVLG